MTGTEAHYLVEKIFKMHSNKLIDVGLEIEQFNRYSDGWVRIWISAIINNNDYGFSFEIPQRAFYYHNSQRLDPYIRDAVRDLHYDIAADYYKLFRTGIYSFTEREITIAIRHLAIKERLNYLANLSDSPSL